MKNKFIFLVLLIFATPIFGLSQLDGLVCDGEVERALALAAVMRARITELSQSTVLSEAERDAQCKKLEDELGWGLQFAVAHYPRSAKKSLQMINGFIDSGSVDVKSTQKKHAECALISAAGQKNATPVMKVLLDKGVSPDADNDHGDHAKPYRTTALVEASGSIYGNVEAVALLLQHGADTEKTAIYVGSAGTTPERTPLNEAYDPFLRHENYDRIAEMLIKASAFQRACKESLNPTSPIVKANKREKQEREGFAQCMRKAGEMATR